MPHFKSTIQIPRNKMFFANNARFLFTSVLAYVPWLFASCFVWDVVRPSSAFLRTLYTSLDFYAWNTQKCGLTWPLHYSVRHQRSRLCPRHFVRRSGLDGDTCMQFGQTRPQVWLRQKAQGGVLQGLDLGWMQRGHRVWRQILQRLCWRSGEGTGIHRAVPNCDERAQQRGRTRGEWAMSNFSCGLTRNVTSHSIENLAFHS